MKRLIGTGLSVLLLSALSVTAANASENRLEYQLHLTHHPVPAMTQSSMTGTPKVSINMPAETPKMKPAQPQNQVQLVRSGNPYAQKTRPLWDPVQNVILPVNY